MRLFITGANRGLGFELAKLSLLEGHTVFAGAHVKEGSHALNALKR